MLASHNFANEVPRGRVMVDTTGTIVVWYSEDEASSQPSVTSLAGLKTVCKRAQRVL